MTRLKAHFQKVKSPPVKGQNMDTLRKQLEQRMGSGNVTDDMLSHMAQTQMVQPVALMPGGPHNDFTHTNMYVDDGGQLKNLPPNQRASELCIHAGTPHQVNGDAFLGRIADDGNERYERLDFRLNEVASDAPRILQAKAFHSQTDGPSRQRAQELKQQVGAITPEANAPAAPTPMAPAELPTALGAYEWSQDEEEVTVEVLVPAGTKSKDINVVFKPGHIRIQVVTLPVEQQCVLDSDIGGKIDCEECSWGLCDAKGGRQLTVTLVKNAGLTGLWADFLMP